MVKVYRTGPHGEEMVEYSDDVAEKGCLVDDPLLTIVKRLGVISNTLLILAMLIIIIISCTMLAGFLSLIAKGIL
jgi:hypothetical protein